MKFAFFGTPEIAATALERMADLGAVPRLVVASPDALVGRKQVLTPPPTKRWAEMRNIPVFQPSSLQDPTALTPLTETDWDYFVVFAFGKLIPEWLIELPKFKTINAHPSLLPKLRGASPIRSTLLTDLSACGVTIMHLDKELDHGPILLQQPVALDHPIPGRALDTRLSLIAGDLLVRTMNELSDGLLTPEPQDHAQASFCTKITKAMAELTIDPYHLPTGEMADTCYRKICAFDGWPEAFFIYDNKRFKIKAAELTSAGMLRITRIIPEGKNEMDFFAYFKA